MCNEAIRTLSVSGHALYDEYGKDIVCAAVSSVTINIINAIQELLDVKLDAEQSSGKIVCHVPDFREEACSPALTERVHLLMDTLVFSLKSIAAEYPAFILISERTTAIKKGKRSE